MTVTATSTATRPTRSDVAVRPGPRLRDAPGVRFGFANALVLLVLPALMLAGIGVIPTDALLVVVTGVACWTLPRPVAAFMGVVAWAWATGFTEHAYGDLTFSSADLTRLAASVAGTVLVAIVTRRVLGAHGAHWSRGRASSLR